MSKIKNKKFFFSYLLLSGLFCSSVFASEFKWDLFGSAYYGQSLTKNVQSYGFNYGSQSDFIDFSLIGLNLNVALNENWKGFAQIVGLGANSQNSNFNNFVQFGYISYQNDADVVFKAGRQGAPLWTTGDTLRVAYDQPFRAKPQFVYNINSFSGFDGFSIAKGLNFGNGVKGKISAFVGQPVVDSVNYGNYYVSDFFGAKLGLDGEGWKISLQGSQYSNKLFVTNVDSLSATVQNVTVGYVFDKNNFVSWGEYGYFASPNGTHVTSSAMGGYGAENGNYLKKAEGGYILLGYRFGEILPRYTYARTISKDAFSPGSIASHVVGLNWTLAKNVVAKAELEIDIFPINENNYMLLSANRFTGGPTATIDQTLTVARSIFVGFDFML